MYMDKHSHYLLAIYKGIIQIYGETFKLKDAVLTEFSEGLTLKNESEEFDLITVNPSSLVVFDN